MKFSQETAGKFLDSAFESRSLSVTQKISVRIFSAVKRPNQREGHIGTYRDIQYRDIYVTCNESPRFMNYHDDNTESFSSKKCCKTQLNVHAQGA